MAKRITTTLAAVLLAFAGTTWWALESGGVAILETTDELGAMRVTHVWFAEREGILWLEAGTPENGWFLDVHRNPELVLRIDEVPTRWRANPVPGAAERIALRAALHEKYGFRDSWVGMFVDSSESIPVRLESAGPGF